MQITFYQTLKVEINTLPTKVYLVVHKWEKEEITRWT